jgi:hypothetical protein
MDLAVAVWGNQVEELVELMLEMLLFITALAQEMESLILGAAAVLDLMHKVVVAQVWLLYLEQC